MLRQKSCLSNSLGAALLTSEETQRCTNCVFVVHKAVRQQIKLFMYRQRAIYYTEKFLSASHLLRFVNALHNTGEEAKVMCFVNISW
jgi:hypothetical protein